MGKVKMQNNLNFSLDATTVDATTETCGMVAISSDYKLSKMLVFSYILL